MAYEDRHAQAKAQRLSQARADRQAVKDQRELRRDIEVTLPQAMAVIRRRIERESGLVLCLTCGKVGKLYKGGKDGRICLACGRIKQAAYVGRQSEETKRRWNLNARLALTPERRMAKAAATRVRKAIRGYAIGKVSRDRRVSYLGCSPADAAAYLEAQFKHGMTWANYGKLWHIDHVIPVSSFDMTSEEDRRKCFHYTNIRPMLAVENMRKGDKPLDRPHQPGLLLAF